VIELSFDFLEGRFVLGLAGQFEEDVEVLELPVDSRPGLQNGFDAVLLPQDLLRTLRVVPQVRLGRFLLQIGQFPFQSLDVKDNLGGFPPAS
jgi:hypothetical protein